MSLDQQPAHADPAPKPRSAGERAVVIAFVVVTVLAVIGLAIIVAAGDDPQAPPQPPPAAVDKPNQPIAPDEQTSAKTPNDLAAEAAEARYREYLRIESEVAQAGYQSSAPFDAVSVSPERVNLELVFRAAQQAGARAIGEPILASLAVTTVDLQPEPGGYPKVVLQACVDVSDVEVVDGAGKSLVTPDRVDRTASTVTLHKYEPGTPGAEQGGWYVYEATSTGEAC